MITTVIRGTWNYIKDDFKSNHIRFFAEVFAWACSVVSSLIFAFTAPDVPIVPLYGIFITGCCCAAWSAYTRKSFGLLANYGFLITIDCFGLARMLLNH